MKNKTWALIALLVLVGCSDEHPQSKGALTPAPVPEVGSFENPQLWSPSDDGYKPKHFCIHNHEYMQWGHGAIPLFYNDVGGRPIQCGPDAKL